MLDGVRKFVRDRFERVSSKSPEDVARTLAERGQAGREQAGRIARDVVEWSKKNREVIAEVVQREVRHQITRLGVASKEEVSSLRRRVRDLEGEVRPKKAAAKATPATSTAKKKTAGSSTTRAKTSAKKNAARKTATKKAAARKSSRPATPA